MYIHIYVYIFSKQHELSYNFFNLISLLLYLYLKKKKVLFPCSRGLMKGWCWQKAKLLSPLESEAPNLALFCLALMQAGFSRGTKHPQPSHFTLLFNYSIQNFQEVEDSFLRKKKEILKICFYNVTLQVGGRELKKI